MTKACENAETRVCQSTTVVLYMQAKISVFKSWSRQFSLRWKKTLNYATPALNTIYPVEKESLI